MTTVVVSPHLDDAIFSIPGVIKSLCDQEGDVVVLSVFTEGDERHAARRDEDRTATSIVGATAIHLGLLDAPFRRAIGETFRELILTELHDNDADASDVADALLDRIARIAPDTLFFPLGVGNHIDHRIVHRAHTRFSGDVRFYEDRPYSLVRHSVHARTAALGATIDGLLAEPSPRMVEEYLADAAHAPYVRAFLPLEDRSSCLSALAATLSKPNGPSGLHLRSQRFAFDNDTFDVSSRAIGAYASQLTSLFGHERSLGNFAYEECIYFRSVM